MTRHRSGVLAWPVLVGVLAVAGCANRVVTAPNPLDVDPSEYQRLFDAAALVLKDEGFAIDRSDYRFGVLTTRPLAAPTVLEPWHGSNTTAGQALASTVNDQRRAARVTLEPTGDNPAAPDSYNLAVQVDIERLQVPTRRLSGSTDGRHLFSHLKQVPTELQDRGIEPEYWRVVSRDEVMEQRIIDRIVRRSFDLPQPVNQ